MFQISLSQKRIATHSRCISSSWQ